MFARLKSLFALRQSTGFLLARQDDRLLEDIGLTRSELNAMHQGLTGLQQPTQHEIPLFIRRQAA